MRDKEILISVVIPVKNGEATIAKCLKGLFSQTIAASLEVIIIDSGSTDSTLSIVKKFPVKVHHIDPVSFNHGETRNYGVNLAIGEYVFMTVQDAWTEDAMLIERMMEHFKDPDVVGVCGQQIVPHKNEYNPIQWFRPYSEPFPKSYKFETKLEFEELSPDEKSIVAGWDNVIALYRKSYIMFHTFQRTNFSEDIRWAKSALIEGKRLVYDYRNRVNHYHYETFNYRYKREFIENFQRFHVYGIWPSIMKTFINEIKRILHVTLKQEVKFKWILYHFVISFSQLLSSTEFYIRLKLIGLKNVEGRYISISKEIPQGIGTY